MESKMSNTNERRVFVEVVGQHSAIGKSLMSDCVYISARNSGAATQLIRVEAKRENRVRWSDEISIHSEGFILTSETAAGTVGVMKTFFDAADRFRHQHGVLILDWGAGLLEHRLNAFGGSAFDHVMSAAQAELVTFVITTRELDHMREAATIVAGNNELMPNSRTIVVFNEARGKFEFASSSESNDVFEQLRASAGAGRTLNMSRVGGESIRTLAPLDMSLIDVLKLAPGEVARRLGLSEFAAIACQSNLAAFLAQMDRRIGDCLSFRAASDTAA
jgi:hypothetical protein